MTQFQFSTIFSTRRKELQLTQENVAQFVGVSRAAVSKWEKGQSYPDITLLPKLAMYFDLSIDTLLGYEPQLTPQRIASAYAELAQRFANEPFTQVEDDIERLIAEYYSCYPFITKMAQLYLNYIQHSPHLEKTAQQIINVCERVKRNSEDLHLLNEASSLEATTYLVLQQPQEVIDRLGDEPTVNFNRELLVTAALTMLGQQQKAKQVAQVSTYQHVFLIIGAMTESLTLEATNQHYVDESVHRIQSLLQLFDVNAMNINCSLVFYVKAASVYAMQQNMDRASQMVAHYFKTCLHMQFPLQLTGDDYFYLVQDWLNSQHNVMQQAPRDEKSIKCDILVTIDKNPLLAPLLDQPELKILYTNVKHHLKEV